MKIFITLCFLPSLLLMPKGTDDGEFDANINKLLSPGFRCFKQREGVTCPPRSACEPSKNSETRCGNRTQCCVSTKDPLTLFYLFTPKNKDQPEFLHECGGRLPSNTFYDRELNTLILTHGLFDGPCRTAAWREMVLQFWKRGPYNIILVDWSRENIPDIYGALKANKFVGKRVCCLIRNIMKQKNVSTDKFHLIGHSMGAHISGFAGQCINKCTDKPLRRITALDPSNFGYYGYPPDERLSCDDARLIDAIHTNIGDCFPLNIGYKENIAHADFYPNGGTVQLSCIPYNFYSYLKLDIFYATVSLLPSFCFHDQALQYFKASINPCDCQFIGVNCKNYYEFKDGSCRSCNGNDSSCAVMGMDFENYFVSSECGSQAYYLKTKIACPYCDNSGIKLNGFPKSAEKEDPGLHCFESKAKP